MNDDSTSEPKKKRKDGSEISIVLLGPLPIDGDVFGGAKLSFSQLVDGLQRRGHYNISVVNTSRPLRGLGLFRRILLNSYSLLKVLASLWKQAGTAKLIMWNVSSGGAISSGPLIWFLCKIRSRPLIVRLFGGGFDTSFSQASALKRKLICRTLMQSDLVLFQTRGLMDQFVNAARVGWFPTTRNMPVRTREFPSRCRHLLFIGQLRREKGLYEILQASKSLPEDVTVAIYGLPMDGFDVTEFENYPQVNFMGPLSHHQVPLVLETHDILLFPSYYEGEGYPGVVIEAIQLGLPVLATRWKSIPEVIEHGKSGLLIEPRSVSSLLSAVNRVVNDDELFNNMILGAKDRGEMFRSNRVLDQLEDWIDELI